MNNSVTPETSLPQPPTPPNSKEVSDLIRIAKLNARSGKPDKWVAEFLLRNRIALPRQFDQSLLGKLARSEQTVDLTLHKIQEAFNEATDQWVNENLLPRSIDANRPMLEQLEEAVINNAMDNEELALGQSYLERNFWGVPGLVRELTPSREGTEDSD